MITPVWALTGARGAMFPIAPVLVGLLLWRYAARSAARGWLRWAPIRPAA